VATHFNRKVIKGDEYGITLELFLRIYVPSGQNSQFGRLTKNPTSPDVLRQIFIFLLQMNDKA
jgi:hypothetical protein